ncbi:MAG: hypothetical protein WBL67_21655, partial [Nitrososphaeraceae archaeon]
VRCIWFTILTRSGPVHVVFITTTFNLRLLQSDICRSSSLFLKNTNRYQPTHNESVFPYCGRKWKRSTRQDANSFDAFQFSAFWHQKI